MQWITHRFYRIFTIHSITWALLFALFSVILPPVAVASTESDVEAIKNTLNLLNTFVQDEIYPLLDENDQAEFQNRVLRSLVGRGLSESFSWSDTDNIRAYLEALSRSVGDKTSPATGTLLYYQKQQYSRLYSILAALEGLSNVVQNASINSSSSAAPSFVDVLAGNPWWATNSAFALTQRDYSRAYPNEYPNNAGTFSFPQFLSQWSGFLTYPNNNSGNTINLATLRQNWDKYFGLASRTWDANSAKPYTWFDFMADAMRSNWVLQSSAIDSSATDSDYIVNHLDTITESSYRNEFYSYSNSVASISNNILITSKVSTNELMQFAENPINTEPEPETNALPSFELSLGEIEGNPFDPFVDDIQNLLPSWDPQGSPNMVVIPEMTIGGIHVPMGQADFLSFGNRDSNSSIVPIIQAFCRWAWHLVCLVGLFLIVRAEFNFWSTLGGSASD